MRIETATARFCTLRTIPLKGWVGLSFCNVDALLELQNRKPTRQEILR
jgi:hypothetical protein